MTFQITMIGNFQGNKVISRYQPNKEVADFTALVQKDYAIGDEILNKAWVELNDRSVIDDKDRGQKTFNAFVDENIENPAEKWKWIGTRSKARNKAIAMHAQITAGYIIPMFMAQNEDGEEDQDFADFMRDIIEWMIHNSDYKSSFLAIVMGMLMNPINYLGAEFREIYQTIKEKTDKGYIKKEVLDEVLSGFNAPVYSADQLLIANAYEPNIQRQRFIIKKRFIDYEEARALYGDHDNWDFVLMGHRTLYNKSDGMFYDNKDDFHQLLVEECIYLNRSEDVEVPFVAGIYLGDKSVKDNPIRHRDNQNRPKYNVVPFGYQRVNEHFFFYKSLMNSMYWDNMLLDAQYQLGMNRMFLDTNMPIAISGEDKIDSEVVFPSSVISFKDKDTKVSPILPQANLENVFASMRATEASMEESSVSNQTAGQLGDPNQKATALLLAEQNAKKMLQGVGKTIAESVVQYGNLMADIAVNYLSIPEVGEIIGDQSQIKYRTFILNNQTVSGRQVSKVLKFDKNLLGKEMTDKDRKRENIKMLSDIKYPNNKQHLIRINPELFAMRKYFSRVEPELLFPKNEEYIQAVATQMYNMLRNDELVEPEKLVREVVHSFYRGRSDEFISKQTTDVMGFMNQRRPQVPTGKATLPNKQKITAVGQ